MHKYGKAGLTDLGLDYEAAGRGVQSAIKYEAEQRKAINPRNMSEELKHLRTGIDLRAADHMGLATLLLDKGVFTIEEYLEYMRLAANHELARYEEHLRQTYGLHPNISFR